MKRTLKIAFGLALSTMIIAPAFADDNFPDVPANHWAFDALDHLKAEGILVGYPDMKYRGTRLTTRYEMAVAINAAYKKFLSLHDGLAEQVKQLEEAMKGGNSGDMKSQLDALKAQVEGMSKWGDDAAAMKKLVEGFEKELTGLGENVNSMKESLGSLEKRVSKLESVKLPVDISGDLTFFATATNSRNRSVGISKEGRYEGGTAGNNNLHGLTKDVAVFHELGINLKGTNESGPKWHAQLVHTNMLDNGNTGPYGSGRGLSYSGAQFGGSTYASQKGDFYINEAAVDFDTSVAGLGFSASVGRIKKEVSPLTFARQNNNEYFQSDRWNDLHYRMDGANLMFNFGQVAFQLFGGKISDINTSQTQNLNSIGFSSFDPTTGLTNGTATANTVLGAQIGFNIGSMGHLGAEYIFLDADKDGASGVNRLATLGAQFDANIMNAIKFAAAYAKTTAQRNTSNISGNDKRNQAFTVSADYDKEKWGLGVEYRKIEERFQGAGNWRRLGLFWNPRGFNTITVKGHINVSNNLSLNAGAEFGQVDSNFSSFAGLGAVNKDKIEDFFVGADYKVNGNWTAMAKYEEDKIKTNPNAKMRWASLGFGYSLGTNALLNFAYEVSSHRNIAGKNYAGGLFWSQLTVKF